MYQLKPPVMWPSRHAGAPSFKVAADDQAMPLIVVRQSHVIAYVEIVLWC
jgi:hypothetical protein